MRDAIRSTDLQVTLWFQHWPQWLYVPMTGFSIVGGPAVVLTAAALIAIWAYANERRQLALAFALTFPAMGIDSLLKELIHRARPSTQYAQDMIIHTYSFPSGHAFGSLVFYGLLAYLAHRHLEGPWSIAVPVLLGLLVLMVGVSRMYLGAHYLLDVLGGWALGLVLLAVIIKLAKL